MKRAIINRIFSPKRLDITLCVRNMVTILYKYPARFRLYKEDSLSLCCNSEFPKFGINQRMNRKLEKQIQAEYQLSKTRKYELVTEGGKEGRNNFVFKQEQSVHRSEEIDKRGKRQTMEKGYKKVFIQFKNTEFNCKIRKYEFFSSQCLSARVRAA